jgi:hypothetical protein
LKSQENVLVSQPTPRIILISILVLFSVDPSQKNIHVRILAGITTGGAAVLVAQPTDVVKVRMQAPGGKARYRNSLTAYRTIALQEGVRGLWKGK